MTNSGYHAVFGVVKCKEIAGSVTCSLNIVKYDASDIWLLREVYLTQLMSNLLSQ